MLSFIVFVLAVLGLFMGLAVLLYPPYWPLYLALFGLWVLYGVYKNRRVRK